MLAVTLKKVLPVLIGGLLGFGYYRFIGCSGGGCPITSNPYASIIYGMLVGSLFI